MTLFYKDHGKLLWLLHLTTKIEDTDKHGTYYNSFPKCIFPPPGLRSVKLLFKQLNPRTLGTGVVAFIKLNVSLSCCASLGYH